MDQRPLPVEGSLISSYQNELATANDLQGIEHNPAAAYLISLTSKRSRSTMASFLGVVARMLGYQGVADFPWNTLQRFHVQAVIELLVSENKAPATINTYLSAIKGVAFEAWVMKQMDIDTYQQIKHVRSVKGYRIPKGRALSRGEIKALFTVCQQDRTAKGLRDAAIISVLLGCGLRRSEVVALDVDDINMHDMALKVVGKGNKERLSYMPENTFDRIERWKDEVRGDEPGPLFTRIRRFDDVTTDRLADQSIQYILDTRRTEAGIDKCTPHDLRRTFASEMLNNAEDIITVKDAMGHASITTTEQYDHRGAERLKQASQRLKIG